MPFSLRPINSRPLSNRLATMQYPTESKQGKREGGCFNFYRFK
jgi:hypothetical protein